jgi:hypothetical protein
MGELGLAFRVDASKEMMGVYWKYLHDRSLYQVTNAIEDIIKSGDRFPSVAKIRELAGSYREFKTVERSQAEMIEEFSSADLKPVDAKDFFKTVGDMFGAVPN